MIRVDMQPEPAAFDQDVRQKGLDYLKRKGIPLDGLLPANTKLYPYWRSCLDELYQSYRGTCAYLAVFFERVTGGATVDHFVAKSSRAGSAYEWTNYRLACSTMNSRKWTYDDVLDPFDVEDGWFCLELVSGHIYPNPDVDGPVKESMTDTIRRLGLDGPANREMRARHYQWYREGHYDGEHLKRLSPFVWFEANRQGLL